MSEGVFFSTFPDFWIVSLVWPSYLSMLGKGLQLQTTAPVSLLISLVLLVLSSLFSKVFEKLVNRLVDHLQKCGLFYFQYGFIDLLDQLWVSCI